MAYNQMYGNPNMGYPQYNNNDLNSMQNQIAQLQMMRNQIQSPIQNNQPQPNGVIQIRTYVVVKTIQDMENYPVPVDGTPVNIFVENTGVFYSKKMANGSTNCQPFSFSALNNGKVEEETTNNNETMPLWAENLLDRLSKLEKKENVKKVPNSKPKVEVAEDGI
jgi:hypothetical protein